MKKFTITHPHFTLPKVRKTHYRKTLFAVITVMLAAHWYMPNYEHWAAFVANLAFFWEPTIEV
jgi:hypothetical protein